MIPAGRSRRDFWVSWGSLLFKFQCRMYNQRVFAAFDQDENVSMVTCKNDIYSWTSWCVCKCTDRIQKYCDPHSLHICRNNVRTQSTEHYKLHLVIFLQKTFPGNAHKKSANALLLWQIKKARKRESYRFTRLIHSHRAIAMYLTGQHWKDRNPAKQSNQNLRTKRRKWDDHNVEEKSVAKLP